ncbi:MAG: DUF2092 domain-containing protein [Alphaproteobacteria bacterium]
MKRRFACILAGLMLCELAGAPISVIAAANAQSVQPAISADASNAVLQMGKTLEAKEFSFKAQTIRVFEDADAQPLHIFHTMSVIVRRPDRLAVQITGDDGSAKLLYDGKTLTVFNAAKNTYATVAAPDNLQAMMKDVVARYNVDFPLADFVAAEPGKAFLTGVTTGREVGTVTIDGKPARHLFFTQPPGIELELWVDKDEKALPRRLLVTYRLLHGQPSFVAQFSDWNFDVHPTDADFTFQPPAGATKAELTAAGVQPAMEGNK